jgi:hypothetical protein
MMPTFLGRAFLLSCILLVALPVAARAQLAPSAVQYATGFNMVGGPPGTDFSSAYELLTYGADGYTPLSTRQATLCVGYWAFFTRPTQVTIPASAGGTQSCPLQPGWNLVGNPFQAAAALPAGVTAFYWNPVSSQYMTVTSIPVGGAVWIYSSIATNILLSTPATVIISGLAGGPYTVHVGDTVELLLPMQPQELATADPLYLHLTGAGVTGPLSCLGSSCALSLVYSFWKWQALQPGTTLITVTPLCTRAMPPCALASAVIQVTIVS